MELDQAYSIGACFAALEDPREARTKWHTTTAIVAIALCAAIQGADDGVAIAEVGGAREAGSRRTLGRGRGTPAPRRPGPHDVWLPARAPV